GSVSPPRLRGEDAGRQVRGGADMAIPRGPQVKAFSTPDRRVLAGIAGLGLIGVLIGGAFAGLLVEAGRDWAGAVAAFDTYLARIAGFTLWQAALSTLLSVAPAIFVARALARHPAFPGRGLILKLFALPLALPA